MDMKVESVMTEPVTRPVEVEPSREKERPSREEENLSVRAAREEDEGMRLPPAPGSYEAIMEMLERHFKVLSLIARNMGVSKEQRELAAQRQKELEGKRRQAEILKKELDAKLREIQYFLADAEDKRRIEEYRKGVRA